MININDTKAVAANKLYKDMQALLEEWLAKNAPTLVLDKVGVRNYFIQDEIVLILHLKPLGKVTEVAGPLLMRP